MTQLNSKIQGNTVIHNRVHYTGLHFNIVQFNTVQYKAEQYSTIQCSKIYFLFPALLESAAAIQQQNPFCILSDWEIGSLHFKLQSIYSQNRKELREKDSKEHHKALLKTNIIGAII